MDWLVCHHCRRKHPLHWKGFDHLRDALADWQEKHLGHPIDLVPDWRDYERYGDNANINVAYQAEQTMTTTNLQSLATSATAGWGSAVVDNTTTLYLDALVQVVLPAVNTLPANDKALYVFAYAGSNSTDLTTTGAASSGAPGTQGGLFFPDITTNPQNLPLIGVIPYVSLNTKIVSPEFSVARPFGVLPPFWGVAIVNYSGMTLAASGNTVKYRGVYATSV
jgi:hypothetical protein